MDGESKTVEKWIKLEKGIRCREHHTRKHGVKKDRYFVIRYTNNGKKCQEALGWASEGMTLDKARIEIGKLKEAVRTGEGACSLAERRQIASKKRKQHEEQLLREKKAAVQFSDYWSDTYWPAQSHKAAGSKVAENALWEKWLKPVLKHVLLNSMSASDLEKIKSAMLTAQKAPASIKYALAVVSQVWTMAEREGLVTGACPTRHVAIPKKDNKRQRYLSKEEEQQLLEALWSRSKIAHDMATIGLDCGLRFSEIALLTWQDCDLAGEKLFIRDPKARSNRFAFMTPRLKELFTKIKEDSKTSNGLIFSTPQGKAIGRISKTFRRIADEMFNQNVIDSRQRVCFHTLRHTFASRLVEGGVSLYAVKELMGHADFKMTQRYSHLSPKGLRDAISILSIKNE